MTFGEPGTILITELKNKELKPYNHKTIKDLNGENEKLLSEMDKLRKLSNKSDVTTELSINFMILKKFHERNIRILKAYDHIRKIRMCDNILENGKMIEDLKNNEIKESSDNSTMYSTEERKFLETFKSSFESYKEDFEFLDFEINEPPLNFFVTIITLEECGVLLNGDEIIELKKNKMYCIKRKSVQHLIDAGLVSII